MTSRTTQSSAGQKQTAASPVLMTNLANCASSGEAAGGERLEPVWDDIPPESD